MAELLLKQEVFDIVGAAMEVYNVMGHGFHEPVYQECLEIELADRRVPFTPQMQLKIKYKQRELKKEYVADFFAFGKVIVEIKAETTLTSADEAQLLNYLKASGMQVGVLINFGAAEGLQWKRMVWTKR